VIIVVATTVCFWVFGLKTPPPPGRVGSGRALRGETGTRIVRNAT